MAIHGLLLYLLIALHHSNWFYSELGGAFFVGAAREVKETSFWGN